MRIKTGENCFRCTQWELSVHIAYTAVKLLPTFVRCLKPMNEHKSIFFSLHRPGSWRLDLRTCVRNGSAVYNRIVDFNKKLCVVQVVIYVSILTMVCMTERRENNRLNIKESSDRWCFLSIGIYGILNFQQRISWFMKNVYKLFWIVFL